MWSDSEIIKKQSGQTSDRTGGFQHEVLSLLTLSFHKSVENVQNSAQRQRPDALLKKESLTFSRALLEYETMKLIQLLQWVALASLCLGAETLWANHISQEQTDDRETFFF